MSMPPPRTPPPPDSRRGAVVGLLVVLVLVLGGLALAHALHRSATVQDCVMSGRTDCAPVDPVAH